MFFIYASKDFLPASQCTITKDIPTASKANRAASFPMPVIRHVGKEKIRVKSKILVNKNKKM